MTETATKNSFYFIIILIAGLSFLLFTVMPGFENPSEKAHTGRDLPETKQHESGDLSKEQAKKARNEYFFTLLRDPETNSIPDNIRSRELNHARSVPTLQEVNRRLKAKNPNFKAVQDFNWQLAGPVNVGGRTRALGIDQRNSDIVIAGGVSGGIWRSTDNGNTWTIRTPNAENFSVTSLAQDPLNPDTWYYTSGEITGGSVTAPGAPYSGTGIFRSTDNGQSWSRIPGTEDDNTQFDSQFDYVNRIAISPTTGSIFLASNGVGVIRSADGNTFSDLTLGGSGEHLHVDVAVASDGTLAAVLSSEDAGDSSNNPGVFVSNDDGMTWTEITPGSFPISHGRSVLSFAPSDPDIFYVLTEIIGGGNGGTSFHKFDISGGLPGTADNRSFNIPDFTDGPVGGMNLQQGYNMTVRVKPDDPDFVLVGSTNLFRSTDGFATAPEDNSTSEKNKYWVGGYDKANDISQYPGQHADQHEIVFDPTNPDRVWVGHDGGLSVSENITASSVTWTDKNNGYIVSQFYDVSLPPSENDNRIMGGAQDNGTPFFEFDRQQNQATSSQDISFADGGYSFFTNNYIVVSNQQNAERSNNRVIRYDKDFAEPFRIVHPKEAKTSLFINPYEIDPQIETIMYYAADNDLWRNTNLNEITNQTNEGSTTNWERVDAAQLPSRYEISALKATNIPNNTLYYAGSDPSNQPEAPVIKRLDNASTTSSGPVDISIPNVPEGAYVHDIAVNPVNGNEVLVVMSNYNIVGLYHSVDAGNSWEAVEGNLTGDNTIGSPNPGPSIRSAAIIPAEGGSIVVLGTSTGIYASQNLDGANTLWGKEAANTIGSSLIENLDARYSDGEIAVGSHGRGIFVGSFQGSIDFNAPSKSTVSQNFPNPFSSSSDTIVPFELANRSAVTLTIYNIAGQQVLQPITEEIYPPGSYNIPVNFSSRLASGIYLYRVIAKPTDTGNTFVGTGKMTFIN